MTSGGRAVLVRDAEQAIAVANLVAPEHLELLTRDADELVHEVRHAGAVFVGTPTALGDYVAGANHVLPTGGAARFSSALRVDDFRRHMHVIRATPGGSARDRTRGRRARPRRGPRGARRVGRAAHRPMIRIEPRADLRELAGYHSPQLDVSVRLNTNESPYPPPPEFVDAWLAGARVTCRSTATRTAPPPTCASAIGGRLGQPADARLPGERLERGAADAPAHLRRPRSAGAGVRADVRARTVTSLGSPGPRWSSAARRDDYLVDPDHAVEVIERERPDVVFVCSPNNPSGTVEPPTTVQAIVAAAPGLVIVDEAYGEFAPSSALELVDDDTPLVVTRTYSKVWSLAALRLGFAIAPASVVAELDKVVLPYHLDVATQTAGILALDHVDAMERRVRHLIEERERLFVALGDLDGIEVFPSGANFLLFRAAGRGHALWAAMVHDGVLVRDFSSWPGVEDCLRVTVGTPEENDAFLPSLARRPARE